MQQWGRHSTKYWKRNGTFHGEITVCPGVYANSQTLEACRSELEEVLEGWLLLRVHQGLTIPEINGMSIEVREDALA